MSDPLWGTGDTPAQATPDWYPDPSGTGGERWWDGNQWTDHVRPPAPIPAYGAAAPAYHGSAKSPILAIVLSVLWLGAGHFYAGRSDALQIVFACVNLVLWILTLTCFIGIIPWIPMVIYAAIDARKSAIEFNQRHGLATPA
jgi:Protein of unknown function (DUF2510)